MKAHDVPLPQVIRVEIGDSIRRELKTFEEALNNRYFLVRGEDRNVHAEEEGAGLIDVLQFCLEYPIAEDAVRRCFVAVKEETEIVEVLAPLLIVHESNDLEQRDYGRWRDVQSKIGRQVDRNSSREDMLKAHEAHCELALRPNDPSCRPQSRSSREDVYDRAAGRAPAMFAAILLAPAAPLQGIREGREGVQVERDNEVNVVRESGKIHEALQCGRADDRDIGSDLFGDGAEPSKVRDLLWSKQDRLGRQLLSEFPRRLERARIVGRQEFGIDEPWGSDHLAVKLPPIDNLAKCTQQGDRSIAIRE